MLKAGLVLGVVCANASVTKLHYVIRALAAKSRPHPSGCFGAPKASGQESVDIGRVLDSVWPHNVMHKLGMSGKPCPDTFGIHRSM